ncbi:RibD family protein [uncultured Thiohalocapsa sp.]|uniref:RibD family protein n=1 Tax=uncultured Thiohalocapsa sp. TaxID=768990 RepID=UPI0025FB52A5|nr:RibD family protein [uncultured Thiohalocapsa sp.]
MLPPTPSTPSAGLPAAAGTAAWTALLAAAGRGGAPSGVAASWLGRGASGAWTIQPDAPAPVRDLLDLYLPLCAGGEDGGWVVGHLGQSLDGCIATHLGESCFVTGPDNILHLHRMRALCDAVVVGAGTVASDDPRLTTRLVAGPSPVRVVLDPGGRLGDGYRLFRDDAAPTLLCTAAGKGGGRRHDRVERLELPADADGLRLHALVGALAERGLRRLFVEGGGVTVSRCLTAGVLSRLQLAVAPLIIGQGRPGVSLPRTERLADALRLTPRIFRMGVDVLYDLDLAAAADAGADLAASPAAQGTLLRVL